MAQALNSLLYKGCKMSSSREQVGMIEVDESVLYIEKDDKKLYAGTGCNSGIIPHHEMEIDDAFSLDENLQEFIEQIERGE